MLKHFKLVIVEYTSKLVKLDPMAGECVSKLFAGFPRKRDWNNCCSKYPTRYPLFLMFFNFWSWGGHFPFYFNFFSPDLT